MQELIFFVNTTVAIFVIVDPFAVIPIYLSMTERFTFPARKAIRRKASMIAGLILLAFALTGLGIFKIFGITLPAFQIAGGILMLLIGIKQLMATRARVQTEESLESLEREDISIFPLATPLLAGPGAISTVVLYSSQAESILQKISIVIAIVLVVLICHIILKIAPELFKWLGKTGLNVFTRLMGIILTAVAIQFILNGISTAFQLPIKSF